MESDSRCGGPGKGPLEEVMRERIRVTIENIVDEELEAALGAAPSRRVGLVRAGYRHGKRARTLTTSLGATTIALPRARIEDDDGRRREWHSRMIPRYQRREEAGDELFTFTSFPSSQWKALRTTNALERINEEFRRRTKTQASLPNEEAALFLLFGLLRSGQITLRRLVGWQDLTNPQMEAA